jgi:phosphatidylglycerophosphate synthase
MTTTLSRRDLATRQAPWAQRLASMLGRAGVQPNAVSLAGVVFAFGAFVVFLMVPRLDRDWRAVCFVAAAMAIQLRLLCNLLDGMLAVESGLGTRTGALFNEIPDRVADVAILVGAGLSIPDLPGGGVLGCAAALAAMFTAYVRLLGGSLGVTQSFTGPMAKQHRMFVLTLAALASAIEAVAGAPAEAIRVALAVIVSGAIITAWRRISLIARELEAR